MAMLRDFAARRPAERSHRVELRFCRSLVEVLGDGDDGPVTGLRVARNRLEPDPRGGVRAIATSEHEVITCGLVIRSIGHRGRPLPGVPFDERRGLIRNQAGRVCEEDGTPRVGEFAVGWIKRGPSGVIGTNKKCAADTVAALLDDLARGRLADPLEVGGDGVEAWLRARVAGLVTWGGWEAIDEHERERGALAGRPRVKLVRIPEMLALVDEARLPA
jgi:ferredoxin--NADP+ reductase